MGEGEARYWQLKEGWEQEKDPGSDALTVTIGPCNIAHKGGWGSGKGLMDVYVS